MLSLSKLSFLANSYTLTANSQPMDPVLFQYQTFTVYTFGFSLTLASLVSAFLLWRRMRQFGYEDIAIIDMVLVSGFLALVFARIFYIATHWSRFHNSVLEMVLVTYFPGLDGLGAMLGIVVGVLLFTFLKRWKALDVFDSVFFALGLGVVIMMMGSFFSGSLPGKVSYLPWATVYPGLVDKRHPIPLYWLVLSIVFFVVTILLDRFRRISGLITTLFLYTFGVGMLVFTPLTELVSSSVVLVYVCVVLMLIIAALLTVLIWRRLPYWTEKQTDESTIPLPHLD